MAARGDTLPDPARWRDAVVAGAAAAVVLTALLFGFVLLMDPYGRRVGPSRAPGPLMDINQRYMYPQLARWSVYDTAVFGTSTTRLLDPRALGAALGGFPVNLAMNAATPWEQVQLAALFVRHAVVPRRLVLGLDRPWCDPDADAPGKRLTFRSFPAWLYDEEPWNDLPHLLNLKTLEIAGRVLLRRLGRVRERIGGDGYEVFTPPEASYDLEKARGNLQANPPEPERATVEPFPALDWLEALLREVPGSVDVVAVFPPLHVSGQARPGSTAERDDEACKGRVVEMLESRPHALVLDYRRPTPLTSEDANFWDRLHYRQPIAARIVADLKGAREGAAPPSDDRYRVLLKRP